MQCSATHEFPIPPRVGEKEEDYWSRVLADKIHEAKDFPKENVDEAMARGRRLIENFCRSKNRIYLIPIENVLHNKASFGDVEGMRDRRASEEDIARVLDSVPDLRELGETSDVYDFPNDMNSVHWNPNFTSEYGVAIYGQIPKEGIEYIEVGRKYDRMQRKALEDGLKDGEGIVV